MRRGSTIHSRSGLQLAQIADHAGTDAPRLVKQAALRLLERDAQFLMAVDRGIVAAGNGEFIEEEEMDARVDRMLKT